MERKEYLERKPFSFSQEEKNDFFSDEILRMSEAHRKGCPEYDRICSGLGEEAPYIPVTLFKDLELCSVPEDKIIRKITSSGTSGQQVSKIFLDGETSMAQQSALCMITGDFIGSRRIPMLIIDSPDVLRDRKKYSARGAGIMGFSMMSSKRFYALDNDMKPDFDSIKAFIEEAGDGPSFAFGFTYMIWEYFCRPFLESGTDCKLGNCTLIHGGGWKKLQNISVSDEVFKNGLRKTWGIEKVSNYYGMAEQTGSIFMECEEGRLHASSYSDIHILNPEDFSECGIGEWGLIALDSLLPESYPGHRLLTEDYGRILGEDNCPCRRKGRYFQIGGRIKKAEVRGCSDTFEKGTEEEKKDFSVIGGLYPPEIQSVDNFDEKVMSFLKDLSDALTKKPGCRRMPEIYALGFWCREGHLNQIKERQRRKSRGSGLVLHIAPSNMPTMFAYSWITSLMAGNSNVVRLSGRTSDITEMLLSEINAVLEKQEHESVRKRNAFVRFPRGSRYLEEISAKASARVVWGGDSTVAEVCAVPSSEKCRDITFPDKYSIAVMDAEYIDSLNEVELRQLVHLFYNDTYGADQNACSSPRTVFWLKARDGGAVKKWWDALAAEAGNYNLQPWIATEKYRTLCRTIASCKGLKTAQCYGNRLYVVPFENVECRLEELEGKFGIFYESMLKDISEIYPYLNDKIQTVVCCGINEEEFLEKVREADCAGVDRAVSVGEALNFDTIWDRKDIIDLLSE